MITALIDADSIVYIVGWNFKDEEAFAAQVIEQACDDFIQSILTLTQAEQYVGVFSAKHCFRHEIYKYKPYKGSRPSAADFIVKWKPVIEAHLITKWGFYKSPNLEADDVVVALAATAEPEDQMVICSPDKDLRQMAGFHFDYRVNTGGIQTVSANEALMNFWTQVLTGDTSDNIAGIPKMGEVKAKKLFEEAARTEELSDMALYQIALNQYLGYFGLYYGAEIFRQTVDTVMMMRPGHAYWADYETTIRSVKQNHTFPVPQQLEQEEEAVLNNLGWKL